MFVVVSLYGLYELFGLVEPLLGAWTMVLSKLSEMSVALSEQAAEISRIRSLMSEGLPGRARNLPRLTLKGIQPIGGLY